MCASRCLGSLTAQLAVIAAIAYSERIDSGKERDKCTDIARSKRDQALIEAAFSDIDPGQELTN